MPSPSPNQLKTPLMTWGEIGETPKRLDRGYKVKIIIFTPLDTQYPLKRLISLWLSILNL